VEWKSDVDAIVGQATRNGATSTMSTESAGIGATVTSACAPLRSPAVHCWRQAFWLTVLPQLPSCCVCAKATVGECADTEQACAMPIAWANSIAASTNRQIARAKRIRPNFTKLVFQTQVAESS